MLPDNLELSEVVYLPQKEKTGSYLEFITGIDKKSNTIDTR
jgi:hypothetical protein